MSSSVEKSRTACSDPDREWVRQGPLSTHGVVPGRKEGGANGCSVAFSLCSPSSDLEDERADSRPSWLSATRRPMGQKSGGWAFWAVPSTTINQLTVEGKNGREEQEKERCHNSQDLPPLVRPVPPSAKESTTHLVLSDLREFLGCPEGGIELLLLRGEKKRIERVEKPDERRRRTRDGTHGRASKSKGTQEVSDTTSTKLCLGVYR